MTRRECTVLIGLLAASNSIACLVHASLYGQVVVWQLSTVNAAVLVLFARDQKEGSAQFAVRWAALLLLVSAPALSGSAVLVMTAMVVVPLQCAIHRHHRQAVTLEAGKCPPHARVKSIDVQTRPDQHAVLAIAYYTGHVVLWRVPYGKDGSATEPEAPAVGVELCHQQPLRSVRFVSRHLGYSSSSEPDPWKGSLLVAGDDGRLFQLNGTTLKVERSATTKAHSDFCRCVEVHPAHPIVLTSADDGTVKMWEADADGGPFAARHVLEGHDDFVMHVKCHPDGRSFVSASLDATLRRWALESTASDITVPSLAPALTFRGHAQGVNCVDFLVRDGAPTVLVSGSDDLSIKFWNYQNGAVIRTIPNAHQDNINAILVHPHRPIMISACEDGTCNVWSLQLDESGIADVLLQDTWNLNKGRSWALAWVGSDDVAIGFDQGCGIARLPSDDQRKRDGAATTNSSSRLLNPHEHVRWLSHVELVS
jgi:WD40 repeat protein